MQPKHLAWVLALVCLPAANALFAQTAQLSLVSTAMEYRGYRKTHDVIDAYLRNGQTDVYSLNLYRNYSYQIVAVCDGDCGDIDLCLYDESGNEIDCDKGVDDIPVVEVTPKWSGRFKIWVRMYDCQVNPCRFKLAVYGK